MSIPVFKWCISSLDKVSKPSIYQINTPSSSISKTEHRYLIAKHSKIYSIWVMLFFLLKYSILNRYNLLCLLVEYHTTLLCIYLFIMVILSLHHNSCILKKIVTYLNIFVMFDSIQTVIQKVIYNYLTHSCVPPPPPLHSSHSVTLGISMNKKKNRKKEIWGHKQS